MSKSHCICGLGIGVRVVIAYTISSPQERSHVLRSELPHSSQDHQIGQHRSGQAHGIDVEDKLDLHDQNATTRIDRCDSLYSTTNLPHPYLLTAIIEIDTTLQRSSCAPVPPMVQPTTRRYGPDLQYHVYLSVPAVASQNAHR